MITVTQKNKDIDLAKKIYLYYNDKLLANLSVGSFNYLQWYKENALLYYMVKMLNNVIRDDDGTLHIGSGDVNEYEVLDTISKIKEYLNYDLNRSLAYDDLDDSGIGSGGETIPDEPAGPPVFDEFEPYWVSFVVTVATNDTPTVTVPFDIDEADIDSLRITVNDGDPIHVVAPEEEGCHFIDNTLYWHTYYNLKAGDKLFIQFLKIA